MMSCKGFLAPNASRIPRITEKHAASVMKAVEVALEHAQDQGHELPDLIAIVRRITLNALQDYPADRSCYTCDFYTQAECLHYKEEVPDEAREAGCDKHQEHGVAF